MMKDRIQPIWSLFRHQAAPPLYANQCSLDELRRMEIAARMFLADVEQALSRRQARYGRKAA